MKEKTTRVRSEKLPSKSGRLITNNVSYGTYNIIYEYNNNNIVTIII
jgi:hypothetical protein